MEEAQLCRGSVDRAEIEFHAARQHEPRRLAGVAMGDGELLDAPALDDLEKAFEEAVAAYETACRVVTALTIERKVANKELRSAILDRDAALSDALRSDPAVKALFEKHNRLRSELVFIEAACSLVIASKHGVPEGFSYWHGAYEGPIDQRLRDDWTDKISQLEFDAETALPT